MLPRNADIPPGTGSILVIDLDAITANFRRIQALAPTAETAVSIKADAYGLGATAVAPALAAAGCRTFFVATAAEAALLRPTLPDAALVVLNGPEPGSAALFAEHRLTPALNSLDQIDVWRTATAAQPAAAEPAYIHIDTGMSRLGLGADELATLAAEPERLAGVDISVVMSHLACADEPGSPMNARQRERLVGAIAALPMTVASARVSLANSAGVFLGADFHFDMVRAGASIYGLNVLNNKLSEMSQVVYLYAKIVQVREVDKAATVGYGATHQVSRRARIATVATGYADGYLRAAGRLSATDKKPTAKAYIGDTAVPVVGRVSMDLLCLDVGDMAAARPGAFVELLGRRFTADDLADAAGTIGYEVLTRLGRRHHRIYWGGDGA